VPLIELPPLPLSPLPALTKSAPAWPPSPPPPLEFCETGAIRGDGAVVGVGSGLTPLHVIV
jgi:hypothetical protein